MKNTNVKTMAVLVALLICGLGLSTYFWSHDDAKSLSVAGVSQTLSLTNPVFAQSSNPFPTFLDEEAGMSIYSNVGQPLELSLAKTAYKTIEKETSDYIVGSVSLPYLQESDEVHCFVQTNGWIVVYYLKTEPASKIIDWNNYMDGKLGKTKLQTGLDKICAALGATAIDMNYCYFQYPYANKWIVIVESQYGGGEDSCRVKIPSEFMCYERSWSHFTNDPGHPTGIYGWVDGSHFKIEGVNINTLNNATRLGSLTDSQMKLDVFCTISVDCDSNGHEAHVGIVLVYNEPS